MGEKITFFFSGKVKKMSLSHFAKKWAKNQFQQEKYFLTLTRITNGTFLWKKITFGFLVMLKDCQFQPKFSFWPNFGIMAQTHFFDLSRKQKWFFSHTHHILFSERPFSVVRKMGYSTSPKLLWNFFVTAAHHCFHSWLFFILRGSPFTLR